MVLILNETQHSPESGSSGATLLAYDIGLTEAVIEATGEHATPRLREVLPALIRHLHGFAREVNLTVDEWFSAVEMVSV
jgi:catechol 1,2-dioxygenase